MCEINRSRPSFAIKNRDVPNSEVVTFIRSRRRASSVGGTRCLPFVAAADGIAAAEAVERFEPGLVQNSTIHPLRSTG
jgi:hypothetical protein